jgi:ketosteroid isomerase-like protein
MSDELWSRTSKELVVTRTTITAQALDELVERVRNATRALIQGDVRRYIALVDEAPDYTLMPPTGGPTRHGSDFSPGRIEVLEEFFAGSGDGDFELERSYAGGDLAVLVGVERQHGTVGGVEQDWSLRVTLVFRRDAAGWRLAHRHADALVHPIDMEGLARLARGVPSSGSGSPQVVLRQTAPHDACRP